MKTEVQEPPAKSGIELANWNWRAVRRFVADWFGVRLCCCSSLNYLHRLGFAFKRPKKRLLKANEAKREAFVAEYAALRDEAKRSGGKIFFADEAHFRADAELRGKWVLRGEPALVDSTSPRYGEKASYYSAVCLETGEVEWMDLDDNSNSGTSAAFLEQLRDRHPGPLSVSCCNIGEMARKVAVKCAITGCHYQRLGQWPGPPGGRGEGVPQHPRSGIEAGQSAGL